MPRHNHRHQNATTETTYNPPPPPPPQQPPQSSKPNPKLLYILLQVLIMTFIISLFFIFIGVAAIIFLHLCVAGGALHRRRNRRRPNSIDVEKPSGYSLDLLNKLPKTRFRGLEVCAICLENVKDGEFCRVLPSCKHVFHSNCVDKWLVKVPACPTCRSSVNLMGHDDDDHKEVVNQTAVINWEQLWAACG